MDLYLPDEFYALSEAPNARREEAAATRDDAEWLGGEAFVASDTCIDGRRAEPDPIWRVI
ncbi:MAG TPA: hypothetical protein VJ696_07110 [Rhodanobacteraceae bacterium]|nr:hypothetical protein [Rhodanobacteraceae bacterium]